MSDTLVTEINIFLQHHPKLAETTFGRLSVNDGKLVARLKSGGQVLPKTAARIREFMSDYAQNSAKEVDA